MSKKIKGDAFGSYDVVGHEDIKAIFKHQTLVHDCIELQKDMEAARGNLKALRLKKLTLQSEVRFLRRRHTFLLKNMSRTRQASGIIKPQFVEATQYRESTDEIVNFKNEVALQNINHNRNAYTEKRNIIIVTPHGGMEQCHGRAPQASTSNQMVRINLFDMVDPNKDTIVKTRALTFDLNEISKEEEEQEEVCKPKRFVRSVMDEKLN